MFSDTHFHLLHLSERGVDIRAVLSALAARDTFFGLDIGTQPGDLRSRLALVSAAFPQGLPFLRFSAGLWPSVESIENRKTAVPQLAADIRRAKEEGVPLAALGECGLDHHWNIDGADGRRESDFSCRLLEGEAELFEMQLETARDLGLPVVVHSRDAFEGTLMCIEDVGYHRGVIHCFSYGLEAARAFLDHGWYISLSGAITYTKPSRYEELKLLAQYIPRDRLLLETDAPYLAPVPFRGKTNTPVLVEEVYRYAAQLLEIEAETLSVQIDSNAAALFGNL